MVGFVRSRIFISVLSLPLLSSAFRGALLPIHAPFVFQKALRGHGEISEPADENDDDGKFLAEKFFDELRERQKDTPESSKREKNIPNDKEYFPLKNSQDSRRNDAPRKFTGAAQSLFSERGLDQGENMSNLDRERAREFNLVGNFERTLPIQVGLLVSFFVLVIGVGLTGGISDGSDRDFGSVDEVEILEDEIEQRKLYWEDLSQRQAMNENINPSSTAGSSYWL